MQTIQKMRQAAIASAAVLAFLPMASHAVTATGTAIYTRSATLLTYSNALVVAATGGTTTSGTDFVLDVNSAVLSGNSLTSFATVAAEGLSITSPLLAGKSALLTNFGYNVASSKLTFSLLMNGTGPATTGVFQATAPTSITLDGSGSASFSLSSLFLDTTTSGTIINGLGLGILGVTPAQLSGIDFGSMAVKVNVAVPEPSTYALMGLGLAGAGLVSRRRSNRA